LSFLFFNDLVGLSGVGSSSNKMPLGKAYFTVRFLLPFLVLLITLITGEEDVFLTDFLDIAEVALLLVLGLFSFVAAA